MLKVILENESRKRFSVQTASQKSSAVSLCFSSGFCPGGLEALVLAQSVMSLQLCALYPPSVLVVLKGSNLDAGRYI